jgi:hypothetical protein
MYIQAVRVIIEAVQHRVDRVISFFSSRQIWDSPHPSPAGECAPHPLVRGGGHTRLRERGWGSRNSYERTYTVVLCVYKYFVLCRFRKT